MNTKCFSVASILLCSAAVSAAACKSTVNGGDDNGTDTGELEISTNTLAVAPADLPDPSDGSGSSSVSTGGGPTIDPESLVIFVGSTDLTCAAPPATIFDLAGECPDVGAHLVRFTLAPEQQAVGTYSLQAVGGFSEEIIPNGDGTCGFGGGTFWDGTVEVTAVHADTIELTLSNTMSLSGESVDGDYVVPRCSTGNPPPPPDAIAIRRDAFPPIDGGDTTAVTSTGSGGSLPGDDLFLITGNQTPVCEDPFGLPGCEAPGWSVSIGLPAAYQTPGVYSLSDPALYASFSVGLGSPGECSGGGGSYFDGSIEIIAIDAQHVQYELSGTANLWGDFGNADGTYTAARCD
jgi:hypothetical protein